MHTTNSAQCSTDSLDRPVESCLVNEEHDLLQEQGPADTFRGGGLCIALKVAQVLKTVLKVILQIGAG
jgi:hypothetical protein